MVKFTSTIVTTALLSVPALAMSVKQYERDLAESDLYGRDLFSDEEAFAAREDLDAELEAREPVNPAAVVHVLHLLHKHAHHASGLLPNGNQGNDRREFEDEDIYGRELDFDEDLEAREPVNPAAVMHVLHLLHKHAHHASRLLPNGNQGNDRRELEDEDIFERELDDDLFERDFDELLTREYYDDLD